MSRMIRASILLLLAVGFAGCYRYAPVESPEPGMEVRAQLEADAAARRSQGLDDPILWYDGMVVDLTSEYLSLDVVVARSTSAFQDVVIRDTVSLARAEVRSVSQRTLSPVRSALFAVGMGVAAFGVVKSIDAIAGGTEDDPDDRPQATLIPVFSVNPLRLLPSFLPWMRDP